MVSLTARAVSPSTMAGTGGRARHWRVGTRCEPEQVRTRRPVCVAARSARTRGGCQARAIRACAPSAYRSGDHKPDFMQCVAPIRRSILYGLFVCGS